MARPDIHDRIIAQRKLRLAQGRIRSRRSISRRDGVRLELDGRWLTGFCSNDYLGLSQQFEVIAALQDAAGREGAGSTASHLVCGHHSLHEQLEREMADWLGYPRALLFDSGFMANLAVQQALLSEETDICVQDRLNHASLLDASRLAGCRLRRYPHLDSEGAMRQLKNAGDGAAMLVTDGVFSMDGDIAPLRSLSLVARMQEALFYVDDAHGIGVIGEHGRGCVADAGLGVNEVPLQLLTLSKALGGHGAVVVGEDALIQHLAETARPYIYTTALPPAQAAASLAAVKLARRDHWRRDKLTELIASFRDGARHHGLELMASETPIQPLLCGDEATVMALSATLEQSGFLVSAIRPPTVPEGKARLRVTLSALHTPEQVRGLVEAIASARDRVNLAAREAAPPPLPVFGLRTGCNAMHIEVTGSGPALVLIHGWALHGGIFAPLLERLAPHFELHVVDLPSHGHSRDDATPLRLPYLVNAIASATPAAVWCGWSLGGLVALHGAATLPQVRGLAMLAATPRFVRDADWPDAVEPVVFEQFGRDLEQDYRGTLERFLALDVMGSQHARSELRTLRDALVERGEPAPRALHEGLALLERSDLRGSLPSLHKPGLWIGGQRDRLVPSKAMHQAAALAPAGLHAAHTIDGGGHAPFLGHADHVAGLLQQFVAGCA